LQERPAPCVFVLIHSFPFHSISFGSIPFFIWKNGTQRSGTEGGREGGRESKKLFLYYLEKRNATERNGGREGGRESKKLFLYYLEKRSGMERNGTETGREGRSRIRQPNIAKYIPWTFLPSPFRSASCYADVE
jgi:hypothetical protein